jgi:GNAT superfamily N-acetyltransferase
VPVPNLTTAVPPSPLQRLLDHLPLQRDHRSRSATVRRDLPQGVRPRRDRDVSTCCRLVRRAFFEGQFPDLHDRDPRAWLTGDDVLAAWVAERGGEVVAHVATCRIPPDARTWMRWREITGRDTEELLEVSRLFVRPQFRGLGIARELAGVAVRDIRARGRVPVLEVVDRSRTPPSYAEGGLWRLRSTEPVPQHQGLWAHRMQAAP